MKKLFVALLVVAGIIGLGYVALQAIKMNTKKYSPEAQAAYPNQDAPLLKIDYCQPSKKGRTIFELEDNDNEMALVPNGIVWRTGANEATIFHSEKNLEIGGSVLKAGSYSLFSIPNSGAWEIIFNEEIGQWGTQYDAEKDVLRAKAQVFHDREETELLQLSLYPRKDGEVSLSIRWDRTEALLPIKVLEE